MRYDQFEAREKMVDPLRPQGWTHEEIREYIKGSYEGLAIWYIVHQLLDELAPECDCGGGHSWINVQPGARSNEGHSCACPANPMRRRDGS